MLAIDPEGVIDASRHLLVVADQADDLRLELLRALSLADLPSVTPSFCAEVDEELGLLAQLLATRAELVRTFYFGLDARATAVERSLLASLVDREGVAGDITGAAAVAIIVDNLEVLSPTGAPASFTRDQLLHLAGSHNTDPALVAAIRAFTQDPELFQMLVAYNQEFVPATIQNSHSGTVERFDPANNAIEMRALQQYLEENDLLTALAPALQQNFINGDRPFISPAVLSDLGYSVEDLRRLELPTDDGLLLARAIEFGHFIHSPQQARGFVTGLPVHLTDGVALDIRDVDEAGLKALHVAATRDLGDGVDDLVHHLEVIARLPESASGYRNDQITWAYATLAEVIDRDLNGDLAGRPELAGHTGVNWFHHGAGASDSIGDFIKGAIRSYGMAPIEARQDMADGNQAIFANFLAFVSAYLRGQPIPISTDRRPDGTSVTEADGFDVGTTQMRQAFELIAEARHETDPERRQRLLLESNVRMGLHEQAVVDPYISLPSVPTVAKLAVPLVTFVTSSLRSPAGVAGAVPRTAGEVLTDDGQLMYRDAEGNHLTEAIEIGDPVPDAQLVNNLVDDVDLTTLVGPLPFLQSVENAEVWDELQERMPPIGDVFVQRHTDPAIAATAASQAAGRGTIPPSPTGWTRSTPTRHTTPLDPEVARLNPRS